MYVETRELLKTSNGNYILRCLLPNDVGQNYLGWFSENKTKKFISFSREDLVIDDLESYVVDNLSSPSSLLLGVFRVSDGNHVGNVKFDQISIESQSAIMGILIGDTASRGIGLAVTAIERGAIMIKKLFGFDRFVVRLGVDFNNDSAITAYLKAGFKRCDDRVFKSSKEGFFMERTY